jgi:uncharacterized protein (DUF427 family)
MDTMKVPGPDHPITLTAHPNRVQVLFRGHVIADGADVISLKEASYHPVCYFRREDVAMDFLTRSERDTYCPYKGHAHYYSLMMDGELAEDAVWTYEDPYPAMDPIRGRVAFFPNHVEIHEVVDGPASDSPADVVLHTDSGSGRSQAEHWTPNVSEPRV